VDSDRVLHAFRDVGSDDHGYDAAVCRSHAVDGRRYRPAASKGQTAFQNGGAFSQRLLTGLVRIQRVVLDARRRFVPFHHFRLERVHPMPLPIYHSKRGDVISASAGIPSCSRAGTIGPGVAVTSMVPFAASASLTRYR
jgi:hypothetical protein